MAESSPAISPIPQRSVSVARREVGLQSHTAASLWPDGNLVLGVNAFALITNNHGLFRVTARQLPLRLIAVQTHEVVTG